MFKSTTTTSATLLAVVSCSALIAGSSHAATIDAGSGPTYSLNAFVGSSNAQNLVDTDTGLNPSAMAFANYEGATDLGSSTDGVRFYYDTSGAGLLFIQDVDYYPPSNEILQTSYDGDVKTIIYRFQPDAGFKITSASVASALNAGGPGATITGSWSTDNVTYTSFASGFDKALVDLSTVGFTEGTDLYLRYVLDNDAGDPVNPYATQIFRSIPSSTEDTGFIVNLGIAEVPEPASLSLLSLGAMMLWRRRSASL